MEFKDASAADINDAVTKSYEAFLLYRKLSFAARAGLMQKIAAGIEKQAAELIAKATAETNLPEARLRTEITRTVFQLTSYAEACARGSWMDIRIDTAIPGKNPPRPDLRKTMVPLGPVVVFGASNFPFAYSTAGGDTASALAAGCTVIVKAHPAHPATSHLMASVIHRAVQESGLHEGIFQHVHGASFETGKMLVQHPLVKAVGFTGSFAGGKALHDLSNERKMPIPVFSEMGSTNPVFLLPSELQKEPDPLAKKLAASITQGVGQFCTKPGLMVAMEGEGLQKFKATLGEEISRVAPAKMLHEGIAKAYQQKRSAAMQQPGVNEVCLVAGEEGNATIVSVSAGEFIRNPLLHEEVFGPYSLIITCASPQEMLSVAQHMQGQLTATVAGNAEDLSVYAELITAIGDLCGRLIFNGVPTGVEVCSSMHHGGPFPATTDSRFTAVGQDAMRRFARPLCYQNCPEEHLPAELRNANPLGCWRMVNGELTRAAIE